MTEPVGEPTSEATPPRHEIQLAEVYCISARAERRERVEGDESAERATHVRLSFTELDDARRRFSCRLEVSLTAPVLENELADVSLTVQGNYVASDEIEPSLHAQFVEYTPIVQLWPYARAQFGSLSQLLGITLPPLPLVDVAKAGLPSGLTRVEPAATKASPKRRRTASPRPSTTLKRERTRPPKT